jgi:toxin CptA
MLRLHLKPSLYLAATLVAAHVGSALVLIPLGMPLWAKLTIAASIGASLAHTLWSRALLKSRASLVAVELRDIDGIAVQSRSGEWHEARLLGTSYVTPLLTVLNLKLEDRLFARHVVIVSDAAAAEDFRRLRVLLRWRYGKAG